MSNLLLREIIKLQFYDWALGVLFKGILYNFSCNAPYRGPLYLGQSFSGFIISNQRGLWQSGTACIINYVSEPTPGESECIGFVGVLSGTRFNFMELRQDLEFYV